MITLTDGVGGNGQLDGSADSDLVLCSHRQRVVSVWLQVLDANATVCQKRQKCDTVRDSDVNKDLGLKAKAKDFDPKAKAKAKDLGPNAKTKAKDLSAKTKANAKDLSAKTKAKDLSVKAKAIGKDSGPKAKDKDSKCQGQMFQRSFYIVFNVHVLWVFLCLRTISCRSSILSVYENMDMLLLLMTIDKDECQTPKRWQLSQN